MARVPNTLVWISDYIYYNKLPIHTTKGLNFSYVQQKHKEFYFTVIFILLQH